MKQLVKDLFCYATQLIYNQSEDLAKKILNILVRINSLKDEKVLIDLAYNVEFSIDQDIDLEIIDKVTSIIDIVDYESYDDDDIYYLFINSCYLIRCIEVKLNKTFGEILKS